MRRSFCGKFSAFLLAALLCLVALTGCRDERAAEEQPADSVAETSAPPGLDVGGLYLPLPAPDGFVRLDDADPTLADLRGLPGRRVLLAAFARADGEAGPEKSGLLLVSTLEHWRETNFSAAGFEAAKAAWQADSVPCTQAVLLNFEAAAAGDLADFSAYTYNLGLTGYGPRQIAFAAVEKSGPDFTCVLRGLLYRQGRILSLEYRQPLENLTEIAPLAGGYLDYLDELLRLDEKPASPPPGELAGESARFIPAGRPELSSAARP